MTASPPPVDLDQLSEALAAATPGPWVNPYPFTKLIDAPGSTDNMAIVQCDSAADAAAIVAAVNAAPVLIAELRDLRAREAAVRALHQRAHPTGPTSCVECDKGRKFVPWPCPTATAMGVTE